MKCKICIYFEQIGVYYVNNKLNLVRAQIVIIFESSIMYSVKIFRFGVLCSIETFKPKTKYKNYLQIINIVLIEVPGPWRPTIPTSS